MNMSLNQFVIQDNATVLNALQAINGNIIRFFVVVNNDAKVIGDITEVISVIHSSMMPQ